MFFIRIFSSKIFTLVAFIRQNSTSFPIHYPKPNSCLSTLWSGATAYSQILLHRIYDINQFLPKWFERIINKILHKFYLKCLERSTTLSSNGLSYPSSWWLWFRVREDRWWRWFVGRGFYWFGTVCWATQKTSGWRACIIMTSAWRCCVRRKMGVNEWATPSPCEIHV